jgi:NAD(P)-dependent dehydrogenase (short-subunit alcohol dehydrogenase family)
MQKRDTWFVTGCSSGFGKVLCEELLHSGKKVVATARNPDALQSLIPLAKNPSDLLILKLDVTAKEEIYFARDQALKHFGQIDVLVNNAGYGAMGALEEISETEIRRNFETNVFGLIEMTRAFIPHFREKHSGFFCNLSSVAGMVALPGASVYAATKFAVEGFTEALAGELATFNIKVCMLEPGGFRTEFANRSLTVAPYHPAYDEALASTRKYYETIGGNQPGDPVALVKLIIELAHLDTPPLRVIAGNIAFARVEKKLEQYAKERAEWKAKGLLTDYPEFR